MPTVGRGASSLSIIAYNPGLVPTYQAANPALRENAMTALARLALGIACVVLGGATAGAADYPTRPVRLLVGFPAGGPTDILARLVGAHLAERLGQQFVVENKPGAGSNIATEAAINSAPDGYTHPGLRIGQHHQRHALQEARLRFRARHRAGRRFGAGAECAARASIGAGAYRPGVHRLRQSQSGQDQHGLVRQRHDRPSGRRDVQDDGRRRPRPCPLPGLAAGGDVARRRPDPGDVRRHPGVDRAHPGRARSARSR